MKCASDHCVTCADEGLPLRVVEAGEEIDTVVCRGDDGESSIVMTDLVGVCAPGELLLVHAGVALARLEDEIGTGTGVGS